MRHRASAKFWRHYDALPPDVQRLADRCFELLKKDPRHGSLQLKKVGVYWSARVGIHYRAVAIQDANDLVWFWIGRHDKYDKLLA